MWVERSVEVGDSSGDGDLVTESSSDIVYVNVMMSVRVSVTVRDVDASRVGV